MEDCRQCPFGKKKVEGKPEGSVIHSPLMPTSDVTTNFTLTNVQISQSDVSDSILTVSIHHISSHLPYLKFSVIHLQQSRLFLSCDTFPGVILTTTCIWAWTNRKQHETCQLRFPLLSSTKNVFEAKQLDHKTAQSVEK